MISVTNRTKGSFESDARDWVHRTMIPINPTGAGLLFVILLLVSLATPVFAQPADAPAWTMDDTAGESITFPEDLDRPTVLLFWATWCPYCKGLMPHLQSLLDEYPESELQVIAISIFEEDDAKPESYLQSQGFEFRGIEHGEDVAKLYDVKGTPGLFLIDQGKIQWHLGLAQQAEKRTQGVKKHRLRAARRGPFWAAELRKALDQLQQ